MYDMTVPKMAVDGWTLDAAMDTLRMEQAPVALLYPPRG
jgi:hypothetical protein